MWKLPTKPWFLRGCLVLGGWDYSRYPTKIAGMDIHGYPNHMVLWSPLKKTSCPDSDDSDDSQAAAPVAPPHSAPRCWCGWTHRGKSRRQHCQSAGWVGGKSRGNNEWSRGTPTCLIETLKYERVSVQNAGLENVKRNLNRWPFPRQLKASLRSPRWIQSRNRTVRSNTELPHDTTVEFAHHLVVDP